MPIYPEAERIQVIIEAAHHIVIIQADNPDGDSLGSALALEMILGDLGKRTTLYCGVEMPSYLRYMPGWDRVQQDLPKQFDASVIVDASTLTLLEKLQTTGQLNWLGTRPCIVLDHHENVEKRIEFAGAKLNDPKRSSTGELIYFLALQLGWPLSAQASEFLMSSILGDTQGLTNQLATAETYTVMADLIKHGGDRTKLEELRREFGKMPKEIFKYKAELIRRTEFTNEGTVATVNIPQQEINAYSPLYNPAPLVQSDMLQTKGVAIAIVFKTYDDGRVTGAIRANYGFPIAGELATRLGGGGHAYASGFKITDGRPFNEIKSECLRICTELLATINEGTETHATVQHTDTSN